jgi:hypothetical protein
MALEALPIFLDSIVPSYMAILISVVLVLFFGEVKFIVLIKLFIRLYHKLFALVQNKFKSLQALLLL